MLLNLRLHNTQAKITQTFFGPVIGLFVYLGLMPKLPPLRSSVLLFSGINSKTKVCSNGGVQKKFDKLTLQHRPNKCKFSYFCTNLGPISLLACFFISGQTWVQYWSLDELIVKHIICPQNSKAHFFHWSDNYVLLLINVGLRT